VGERTSCQWGWRPGSIQLVGFAGSGKLEYTSGPWRGIEE
jgi:hypothetical protein